MSAEIDEYPSLQFQNKILRQNIVSRTNKFYKLYVNWPYIGEELNKLKASVLILIVCTMFIALFVQLFMNKYI